MWLGKTKVKGKSIKRPLGVDRLPNQIPEQELDILVTRLRSGDYSVRQELIDGHLRLAISIASRYARQMPSYDDDLVSESMCALLIAIDRAESKLVNNNITPYIVAAIHNRLSEFIRNLHFYPIWEINRKKEKGIILKRPEISKLLNEIPQRTEKVNDIIECIDWAIEKEHNKAQKETKRLIITLRASGYNDREIAEMIHISLPRVQQLRAEVEEQYEFITNFV